MNNFSISQLAQFTGVKAHTIRIWEQRYNVIKPHRSPGNTRYYDDLQLRRLLNIVTLSAIGYKVADLAAMKDAQLFSLLEQRQAGELPASEEYFITSMVNAGLQFDEPLFEKILSHCVLKFSVRDTYVKIIYPLLQRLGLLWSANQLPPATEHFVTNLLRQKLYTAIDGLPSANNGGATWLCFLPEDEFHEIGLLFANWLIRSAGHKVIYLGSNVPLASVSEAAKTTSATHMITFFVRNSSVENQQAFLQAISEKHPQVKILVAAQPGLAKIKTRGQLCFLRTVEDLEQEL